MAGCLGGVDSGEDPVEPPANTADEKRGFSDTHVFGGNYTTDEPHGLPLDEGSYAIGSTEKVYVESPVDTPDPEAADIQIGVVRPDVPEGTEVPVIVQASP